MDISFDRGSGETEVAGQIHALMLCTRTDRILFSHSYFDARQDGHHHGTEFMKYFASARGPRRRMASQHQSVS